MDQVHVVRHKVLVEGRPQRSVAREFGNAGFAILGDPTRGDRQNDVFIYGVSGRA